MKIETLFNFKDHVWIVPLKTNGRVLSVFISADGVQYNVRWIDERQARSCCFFEDELSAAAPPAKIGFNDTVHVPDEPKP